MSHAVQAVIGVVEIAAGAVIDWYTGGTGGNFLIEAGIAQLLGYAVSLLMNPHRSPLEAIGANSVGTLEPRRIIFGELTVGGMYTTPPMTAGPNNDFLDLVFVGAGHPIEGYGDVYFNNLRIANADINTGTGAVTNVVTNNGYEGLAWIRRYDGTQLTVDTTLFTSYTAWDSNHKGRGLAYWAIRLQYNQTAFATGVPNITVHLQGAKLYDPRLDSTNGGSGSQRFATPSTWAYSTNPALCLAWYLTQPLGLGEAFARIDWGLVAAAANICDELPSVPIPIVPGLTTWNASSTLVGGIGTNFLRDLNNGQFTQSGSNWLPTVATYILGPDSAMHQVASVQTDGQLTLSAAYTGGTTTDFVAQWNNSTATTTTQSRYTCNTTLDATARFEDNIAQLARAMMGQCIYSGGIWRMYAGAWTGSAFALAESDLVGGVSVQCSTPRQNLYNAVRGNYISKAKNYQPDEFPAILNATYVTEDGETIYTETNFPCCTDVFEAQRNAMIVSRVSRDMKIVTAEFGMSAYGVKVWETGTMTIAEIGWNQQTVRCIGWRFTPKGSIQLTLQEAYSADWTDPTPANYAIAGTNATAAAGLYLPYPVTALTTTPQPGAIRIDFTLPLQLAPGTQVQILEYTASTPSSSASVVWQGNASPLLLPKVDSVTRYYWARTVGPNGQLSTIYPSGAGVAGAASPVANWVNAQGGYSINDDGFYHYASAGWTAACRSAAGYPSCHISAKINDPSFTNAVFGLSVAANAIAADTYVGSAAYALVDHGWNANCAGGGGDGKWHIIEGGTDIGAIAAINGTTDIPLITYNGTSLIYTLNGTVARTVSLSGASLYGVVVIDEFGGGLNSVDFGPNALLPVVDAQQLGHGAVDPRQVTFLTRGSVPPSVPSNIFSYTNTGGGDMTVTWSAFTLYYADGTTAAVSGGSVSATGLNPGNTYNVYPYVVDGAGAVSFATGFTGSTGSPAMFYINPSAPAGAKMYAQGNNPLAIFQVICASSGGGGGGDSFGCLHPEQPIELASGSRVLAGDLAVGDLLPSPDGPVAIAKLIRRSCGQWVRVRFNDGAAMTVTRDHRFLAPDHFEHRAEDLPIGSILEGRGRNLEVRCLELLDELDYMVRIELEAPHLYYLNGTLSHNPKP